MQLMWTLYEQNGYLVRHKHSVLQLNWIAKHIRHFFRWGPEGSYISITSVFCFYVCAFVNGYVCAFVNGYVCAFVNGFC